MKGLEAFPTVKEGGRITALGRECANAELRSLVFVGDGKLQMNGTELSTRIRHGPAPLQWHFLIAAGGRNGKFSKTRSVTYVNGGSVMGGEEVLVREGWEFSSGPDRCRC